MYELSSVHIVTTMKAIKAKRGTHALFYYYKVNDMTPCSLLLFILEQKNPHNKVAATLQT